MLRTSIHTTAALALTLFTPACDDMTELEEVEVEAGEGEAGPAEGSGSTRFGCFPMPCSNPPLGNTNWIGSNPLDTVTQDSWNVATRLSNGNFVRFTGAWCPTSASPWKFNATAKGELVFWKASTGGTTDSNKVRGTAVEGCKFYAQFSDTESFASSSNVMIKISDAVAVLRADNVTTGFKYLMTVANLNKDLPAYYEDLFPTCYDNDDAPGNYYLTVRPGLMLNTDGWQMMADSSKQSWVCAAGAFGHFALKNVDVEDIGNATVATTEGRAWGLYHHGATHTYTGNPVRIHHATIEGYDPAPDACDPNTKNWYREGLWDNGVLMCRGDNITAWSDEINRNAWSRSKDWDQDTSVGSVSVCNGSQTYTFATYARCYMAGSLRVCPVNNAC